MYDDLNPLSVNKGYADDAEKKTDTVNRESSIAPDDKEINKGISMAPISQGEMNVGYNANNQPGAGQYRVNNQPGVGQYRANNQPGAGQYGANSQPGAGQYGANSQPGAGQYRANNQPGVGQSRANDQPGAVHYAANQGTAKQNQYGETIQNYSPYVSCQSQNGTYASHIQDMKQNAPVTQKPMKNEKTKKHRSVLGIIWSVIGIAATLCFTVFCIIGIIYMVPKIINSNQSEVKDGTTLSSELDKAILESNAIDETQPAKMLTNGEVYAVVTDVTDVVEKVMPAVVSINTVYEGSDFFGRVQEYTGSGSGIIIGENETELLIVTNYHVIQDCVSATVLFCDEEEVPAQVKGRDASMDLAVVAVKLEDIKDSTKDAISVAQMGDSDALKVGEPAIAIGNALGYGQSVTTGVVSALNRQIEVDSESSEKGTFIQTDAAINPGNSGGALLNVNGEVIGINSNKIGGSTIEGMGYAIPISAAKPILEKLMIKDTLEKVDEDKRGAIGITGVNVNPDVASVYGLPVGIYITQVAEDSAAEIAGLEQGDIMTEFDGNQVSDMNELIDLLKYYEAGQTVPIKVKKRVDNYEKESLVTLTLTSKEELEQSDRNE